MALHTDLKIYKTGTRLVALAFDVQKNMPRGYKRGIGEQITGHCTDMLVLMAQANASRGAERVACIRTLLERQTAPAALLQIRGCGPSPSRSSIHDRHKFHQTGKSQAEALFNSTPCGWL